MKVTERVRESAGAPVFICDFSPPRGSGPAYVESASTLDADFICVAYNPGRAVRVDSVAMAHAVKATGKDVAFNLATRDMNKLALQSRLLGAQVLGLENVVVIAGDPFNERDLSLAANVVDYRPTELIGAIAALNEGTDYRGSRLREPTEFCIGATLDLGRGVEREARLAHRKAQAGAAFFITQPIFEPAEADRFYRAYGAMVGEDMVQPVFWGLQVLEKDGVIFSSVPEAVRRELEEGRPGTEIAREMLGRFLEAGLRTIYLVPPILRGGARNYEAAQQVLAAARSV